MFLKKNKGKLISLFVILAVLVFAYSLGGDIPDKKEAGNSDEIFSEEREISLTEEEEVFTPTSETEVNPTEGNVAADDNVAEEINTVEKTVADQYKTQPVPEGRPAPIEPQTVTISDKEMTCTLSIRCDVLLNELDKLEQAKWVLVPKDGIILAEKEVTFYEGESVFNVLLRETRRNGIHMEYVSTPIYNSAYIEGIHNLYEFDAGELSGWMYSVNGWFPNYGCSRYALKEGDRIEWVYTCALGKDIK